MSYRGLRMAFVIIIIIIIIIAPTAAHAALPPHYQRTRELAAILENTVVQQQLRSAPIEGVELMTPDLYLVWAGDCEVQVRIVDDGPPTQIDPRTGAPRPTIVGPRQFAVSVGEAHCGISHRAMRP